MSEEQILDDHINKLKKKGHINFKRDGLSSGSTLLNLGATGRPFACFLAGHYYWFVGDSTSGKTFLALTCFAEACINSKFDGYRLLYDNSEDGALMDIEKFFGKGVVSRIEPPAGTKEEPEFSETTEDFHFNIDDAVEKGVPFIYVLDSMDMLESNEDQEKFKEVKDARRKNKKTTGSFGMQKAKANSAYVRRIVRGCRDTKSIVIIISQTRDNVGYGAQYDPKRASGGRSLKFYATLEIWTSVKEKIKKTLRGKARKIGIRSKIQLKKNRITGKDRDVLVPVYYSIGIDDLGSCVDFLLEEKHWTGTEASINAPEFDFKGPKEKLIQRIENAEEEKELRLLVAKVWGEIEEGLQIKRKSRYG